MFKVTLTFSVDHVAPTRDKDPSNVAALSFAAVKYLSFAAIQCLSFAAVQCLSFASVQCLSFAAEQFWSFAGHCRENSFVSAFSVTVFEVI